MPELQPFAYQYADPPSAPKPCPFLIHLLPGIRRRCPQKMLHRFNIFVSMTIEQLYQIYLRHPSVQTDSRQLKTGDLFFALKGPNFNGNVFAVRALEQGAAYAVIDETLHGTEAATFAGSAPSPGLSDRLIVVPDVLATLQELALFHRRQFDIPFIAITGSNGKTTTKELIHAVLASTYTTYTTPGNLNNHIGIPLTILAVRPNAQLAVIEMGANHQKEIEAYCRYTLPTHGIITNVGKAHLEGFGGPEGVRKGKGELYDFLRSDQMPDSGPTAAPATAFVLQDSADLVKMSRGIPHIVTYGTRDADIVGSVASPSSDASPSSATRWPDGHPSSDASPFLTVDIARGAGTGPIHTQLVGDYNFPNVLAAVAVGKYFGVPDTAIREAIEQYTPSNSRSQMIEKDGNHIILDTYNANPSSMRAAIENFARLPVGGSLEHKVLILGAMAELGTESLAEHRAIVDLIAQYPWQQVVLVGGDFRKISHPYLSFANSKEAGRWLAGVDLRNAYILIKGSRSTKMEEVLEAV
jgi:UDP-N-acetylmuramoyl-tripeptide--D-alanyl-D-alanine ligase